MSPVRAVLEPERGPEAETAASLLLPRALLDLDCTRPRTGTLGHRMRSQPYETWISCTPTVFVLGGRVDEKIPGSRYLPGLKRKREEIGTSLVLVG